MKYDLQLFHDHAIIRTSDDVILIDTGAQHSIHAAGQFSFESAVHPCTANLAGATVDSISALLGMPITTLMGTDVLVKYNLILDYRNRQAEFSSSPLTFNGTPVALEYFTGIPIIPLSISGRMHRFLVDTGAQFSYASAGLIGSFPAAGVVEDFYPGAGKFEVSCHDVVGMLGTEPFTIRCGVAPKMVQRMLSMAGCQGIIGSDLFSHFSVLLNLKDGQMKYVGYV